MEIQRIVSPSGEEMVVLSAADFERLREGLEERQDVADAEHALAEMAVAGGVPGSVLSAILRGVHPIVAWRAHRGLSQARLAEAVGISQTGVARLERAEPGTGRLRTRQAMARALGAPLSSLGN